MKPIVRKKKIDSENSLLDGNPEYLLKKLELTKNPQKKCDIAVQLSFMKGHPRIVRPMFKLLPLWSKTGYSGTKTTVYSRLIVNYYLSNKKIFFGLLGSKDPRVRRIISHAFCFVILADGVDNQKAWELYRKYFRKILSNYVKKEKDNQLAMFVQGFLKAYK